MKVHFMGDPRGDKDTYKKVIDVIEKTGNTLVTDYILHRDQESVEKETEAESELFIKKSTSWIKKADVIIFDVSLPSVSVGFDVATALNYSKPVIVIYNRQAQSLVLNSLKGLNSERMQILSYDMSTLAETLELALDFAEESNDIRFNFFVTPAINAYLDWVAKDKKLPRSVYLRHLIEKDMKNAPDYQDKDE